jgi:hypothetical protein
MVSRRGTALGIIAVTTAALAGAAVLVYKQQQQPPPPPSSNQAFVTLTVIDGSTGSPLQGVAVSAAETASGGQIYNTVYTDATGFATLPVNTGCLPSEPGVGVYVYIFLSGYQPRSFAIQCLLQGQTYPLGPIPLVKG